jgi:hypothetical protein
VKTGMIHYGKLQTSPRLRHALAVLRGYPGGLTSKQWQSRGRICSCGTTKAELKRNGIRISCTFERVTATGAKIYRYVYLGRTK